MQTHFFQNDAFAVIVIGQITEISHYFPLNDRAILKMDSSTSLRNKQTTHTLYHCRGIGIFLGVTLLWIHSIRQNLSRTQWAQVGNNIDYGDSKLVYSYMTQPLQVTDCL